MRYGINILLLALLLVGVCSLAAEGEGWQDSGELPYSFAYARQWFGYRMRKDGWRCVTCFLAGRKGEQEHSVWERGDRKVQVMLCRIDSGKTMYFKSELHSRKGGRE